MRTIKILGFAVAIAAAAVPLQSQQVDLKPGAFPAIDRMARMQTQRLERWQRGQQMRQFRQARWGQRAMAGRNARLRSVPAGQFRGAGWRAMRPAGARMRGIHAGRVGARAGVRAGRAVGARAGFRAGRAVGAQAGLRAANVAKAQTGFRAGRGAGLKAGVQGGRGAGFRAGLRANATPEQKALTEQWQKQRQSVRQQVADGKLTREQARAQMQKWRAEHLPKK